MPASFHDLLKNPDPRYLPYLLRAVMMVSDKLPLAEILSYVKPDKIEDFLLAFGGQQITFPSLQHVAMIARDAKILQAYTEVASGVMHTKTAEYEIGMPWAEIKMRGKAISDLLSQQQ